MSKNNQSPPNDFLSISEAVSQSGEEEIANAAVRARTILGLCAAALRDEFPGKDVNVSDVLKLSEITMSLIEATYDGEEEELTPDEPAKPSAGARSEERAPIARG